MSRQELTPIRWFEEQGIKDYDLVMSNPWKGRQCYTFTAPDGTRQFLKWNDEAEAHAVHWTLMEKEENIYKILQTTDIAPCYILSDGMFVTEYVEGGESLRTKIKNLLQSNDEIEVARLVQETLSKWKQFRMKMADHGDLANHSDNMACFDFYLMSLLVSGPIETKWSVFMRYRNRFLLEMFRYRYKGYVANLLSGKRIEVIHGDFHANNVMVGKLGKVYLLDFENLRYGLPEIELAYMVTQLNKLTEGRLVLSKEISDYIKKCKIVEDYGLYEEVLKIYKKAVSYNPRFK